MSLQEELFSIYPLIYQSMQIRNAEAERARSDPEQFLNKRTGSKFKAYNRIYRRILKKLLFDRNSLMEAIRSDWILKNKIQWGELSRDDLMVLHPQLFGDKASLRVLPTKAKAISEGVDLLEFLKNLRMEDLNGIIVPDPVEDFTSADWNSGVAQKDDNSRLTIIANKVTFTGLPRNEDCWFYRDFGANHFDGNFEHLMETLLDANSGSGDVFVWVIANAIEDVKDLLDASESFLSIFWYSAGAMYLYESDSGTPHADSASLSQDTLYFLEIERDEDVGDHGTAYIYICTGDYWDDGGTQIDNPSVALNSSKKDYRYLYAIDSYDDNNSSNLTGYMQNLDVQEAVAAVVRSRGFIIG